MKKPIALHAMSLSMHFYKLALLTIMFLISVLAPTLVIYDNGCNLHNYILNREPHFFKKTWFLIDRFHWPNHIGKIIMLKVILHKSVFFCLGCSSAYNISKYPQFQDVNTQIVEQSNSFLKRAKSSLSYMNKEHFFSHVKLILWYHNTISK